MAEVDGITGERALPEHGRVLVLEPGRAERHYWRDLWVYRELIAILTWRDVAVGPSASLEPSSE